MNKQLLIGLTVLSSCSAFATENLDLDKLGSQHNPTTMDYYVEHYKNPGNKKYRELLISVRAAADTIDFYTTSLESKNQRIDYCLPMTNSTNRETLWRWKTQDLVKLINNHLDNDPMLKKHGKHGVGGSVGSYLVSALKAQYPCPAQKQRPL